MDVPLRLQPYLGRLAALCEEYGVEELAAFGSVLRVDFDEESDVDLLVRFRPGSRYGLFHLIRLQQAMEALLERPVDLVPEDGLKPLVRGEVLRSSQTLYAA